MPIALGTSNLYLSRDTEIYLEQIVTGAATLTPTGITLSGTAATVTVTHSYSVGDLIKIENSSLPGLNTVHKIATVSTTVSFTFATTLTGSPSPTDIRLYKVNLWRVNALAGADFSQKTATQEVSLSEMQGSSGTSRRGKARFATAYSPADWSFETYAHPMYNGTNHLSGDDALLANMVAVNSYSGTAWATGVTQNGTSSAFSFSGSNVSALGTFTLYYVMGAAKGASNNFFLNDGDTVIFKVDRAVVNSLDITFDVDGICKFAWKGFGALASEVASLNASTALDPSGGDTTNLIRNKLTALKLVSSVSGSSKTYVVTLTGGSLSINNNITFLTPETLGIVNQPIGHVTGARSVSGTFNAYLDQVSLGTNELLRDLQAATTTITNSFATDIYIGGKAVGDATLAPGVQFKMGQVNFDIPSIKTDDVYGVEITWSALPTTLSSADEITAISFIGS